MDESEKPSLIENPERLIGARVLDFCLTQVIESAPAA